jgi:hypothetical protein
MRQELAAAVVGAVLTVPALGLTIFAAGGGHGTYLPAIFLFPFTMLGAAIFGSINPALIALALFQFPMYGYVIGRNVLLSYSIGILHIAAVFASLFTGARNF